MMWISSKRVKDRSAGVATEKENKPRMSKLSKFFLLLGILSVIIFLVFSYFEISQYRILYFITVIAIIAFFIYATRITIKSPFTKERNIWIIVGFSVLILLSIITPLVIPLNFQSQYSFALTMAGVLLTLLGLFVSVQVLIALDRNRTTEIEEYLRELRRIVRNATPGDHVYIIAPTFCPGYIGDNKILLDDLYRIMESQAHKGVVFHWTYLKVGARRRDIPDGAADYIDKAMENCHHWDLIKMFLKEEYNQIKDKHKERSFINGHLDLIYQKGGANQEQDGNNVLAEEGYWIRLLCKITKTGISGCKSYQNDAKESSEDNQSSVCELDKSKYLEYLNDDKTSFAGFFLVANTIKGDYYIGTFIHDDKTKFEGNIFNNKHIKDSMESFIETFCDKNRLNPCPNKSPK
ncbi:membrane protein [Porphyromonas gingivalis]|nr:membrane protein [Porphyromonas gingivalis]AIJ35573.1 hypothetical protein EG14_05855 [Porphyromonas gingivalis]ATR98508.1 hypothetical protein CS550_04595 [Porphyromonas gingivalis]HBW77983.1 hypothetical protein [Porphyromonas gingivalis]